MANKRENLPKGKKIQSGQLTGLITTEMINFYCYLIFFCLCYSFTAWKTAGGSIAYHLEVKISILYSYYTIDVTSLFD